MKENKLGRLVRQAGERYGFNLEFKAKRVFEKSWLASSIQLNEWIKHRERYLEVDIIASKHTNLHAICECKGTSKDSVLILVKDLSEKDPCSPGQRIKCGDSDFQICQFKADKNYFHSFTGDFFNRSQQGLKQASKDDQQNNFYKAQKQMVSALGAFYQDSRFVSKCHRDGIDVIGLVPLIITNAEIWVIDYEQDIVSNHKWALQKVTDKNFLSEGLGCDIDFFQIAVVNIEYLSDFLRFVDQHHDCMIQVEDGGIET